MVFNASDKWSQGKDKGSKYKIKNKMSFQFSKNILLQIYALRKRKHAKILPG